MTLPLPAAQFIALAGTLKDVTAEAACAARVAVDIEASGMHAYRAQACTVQLAWDDGQRVAIVDALATSLAPLSELLGPCGPVKIVHDVAFDARLAAEAGITLGRIHDTAIAARMLGRAATGLASLLESELGLHIRKALQHHDWRIRPLDAAMLAYLAEDVGHLEALDRKLWAEVTERAIEEAVLEETQYRIDCAVASARAPLPTPAQAYLRVKGADRLAEKELAALRVAAELREREAKERDVPPHKVAAAETLIAVARARPKTRVDLVRIRGLAMTSPEGNAFAEKLAGAMARAGEHLPDDERSHWQPVPQSAAFFKARRERETRLLAWRRVEAKTRSVDEQVVLPGHCVKFAADANVQNLEDLARVPGIGTFRIERDGEAILRALDTQVTST